MQIERNINKKFQVQINILYIAPIELAQPQQVKRSRAYFVEERNKISPGKKTKEHRHSQAKANIENKSAFVQSNTYLKNGSKSARQSLQADTSARVNTMWLDLHAQTSVNSLRLTHKFVPGYIQPLITLTPGGYHVKKMCIDI